MVNLQTIVEHDVRIGPISSDLVDYVRMSASTETMTAPVGHGIQEHRHGKSLYFAQNAHLTLDGKVYESSHAAFYALIPENVPHGWQHAGGEGEAIISSFEPGHRAYELYALQR